jgi:hypothetical protein
MTVEYFVVKLGETHYKIAFRLLSNEEIKPNLLSLLNDQYTITGDSNLTRYNKYASYKEAQKGIEEIRFYSAMM